jgi:hypothetical protein
MLFKEKTSKTQCVKLHLGKIFYFCRTSSAKRKTEDVSAKPTESDIKILL